MCRIFFRLGFDSGWNWMIWYCEWIVGSCWWVEDLINIRREFSGGFLSVLSSVFVFFLLRWFVLFRIVIFFWLSVGLSDMKW